MQASLTTFDPHLIENVVVHHAGGRTLMIPEPRSMSLPCLDAVEGRVIYRTAVVLAPYALVALLWMGRVQAMIQCGSYTFKGGSLQEVGAGPNPVGGGAGGSPLSIVFFHFWRAQAGLSSEVLTLKKSACVGLFCMCDGCPNGSPRVPSAQHTASSIHVSFLDANLPGKNCGHFFGASPQAFGTRRGRGGATP